MKTPIQKVSIIVPIYEEQENLPELFDRLDQTMQSGAHEWEVLLINDGSRDQSGEIIQQKADNDNRYRAVQFRRNFGQTAAMQAGFDFASLYPSIMRQWNISPENLSFYP